MLIILLTLIFIRPFICSVAFPGRNYIYSIALIIVLIFWFVFKGISAKLLSLKYPLALFLSAVFLGAFFAKNRVIGFEELYKYVTGLSLFTIAVSLDERQKKYMVNAIVFSGLIISLLAIYQYLFGFKHLSDYMAAHKIADPFIVDYVGRKRVYYPFVTPNILGGYIAMITLLSLTRRYRLLLSIPLCVSLILTKSMGALLVFYIGLTLYFCLTGNFRKKQVLFLSVLLIIISLTFVLRTIMQKEHIQPFFSALARINYWEETLKVIRKSPVLGVGIGNFNLLQSRYAHNSYLQIWAEMGLLGIISFLWLITAILKNSLRNLTSSDNRAEIAALISASVVFLAHNLIDFSFFLPEVASLWWVILGLTLQSK